MKYPSFVIKHLKKRSTITILPTKMGGYLWGLIFLMYLLSIGYNNNLLLIFTLLLFGLNLIWLIQTHFYVYRSSPEEVVIEDGHAKEAVVVRIQWAERFLREENTAEGVLTWSLSLEDEKDSSFEIRGILPEEVTSPGQVTIPERGLWNFKHLRIKTSRPFGLYQTMVYFKINTSTFIYPQRSSFASLPREDLSFLEGENSSPFSGPHDVHNLAPYQGEESRKISWKHYARSGELVVKEGEELKKSVMKFKIPSLIPSREEILSRLAGEILYCAHNNLSYTLETLEGEIIEGHGLNQLQKCLRILAVC